MKIVGESITCFAKLINAKSKNKLINGIITETKEIKNSLGIKDYKYTVKFEDGAVKEIKSALIIT